MTSNHQPAGGADAAAPRVLVLSTSLHPESRSRAMAQHARAVLAELGAEVSWFDCREVEMPYMDGHSAHAHEATAALKSAIAGAQAVVLASGVYNFDVSAVAKACIELGGKSWNDKVVCLMCATGSMVSYMAPLGLANSLMLDFRCVIVPRFPMAMQGAFAGGKVTDPECDRRIREACAAMVALVR